MKKRQQLNKKDEVKKIFPYQIKNKFAALAGDRSVPSVYQEKTPGTCQDVCEKPLRTYHTQVKLSTRRKKAHVPPSFLLVP